MPERSCVVAGDTFDPNWSWFALAAFANADSEIRLHLANAALGRPAPGDKILARMTYHVWLAVEVSAYMVGQRSKF